MVFWSYLTLIKLWSCLHITGNYLPSLLHSLVFFAALLCHTWKSQCTSCTSKPSLSILRNLHKMLLLNSAHWKYYYCHDPLEERDIVDGPGESGSHPHDAVTTLLIFFVTLHTCTSNSYFTEPVQGLLQQTCILREWWLVSSILVSPLTIKVWPLLQEKVHI